MVGANQFMQMGGGAFNSLSHLQFGSTSLSGRNLNAPAAQGAELTPHEFGSPLPMMKNTFGSAQEAMAWRQHGLLPLNSQTFGSTFHFGSGEREHPAAAVEPYTREAPFG